MNIVVHMTPCTPTSTVASARIARFISEHTGAELVHLQTEAHLATQRNDPLDTLIIVNGPMAFCDFLPELGQLVTNARRVVWVQQDYTINPPAADSKAESPFRKAFADKKLRPIYWTTIKNNVKTPQDRYINWNQLTYDPQPLPVLNQPTDPVLFYYGAFREKRIPSFKKWLCDTEYRVKVSTTTLRGKKFTALEHSNIEIVPPFTRLGMLPRCSATLYIEDDKSHREFHSPANRFYEMLSAGIPMFFDVASLPMLAQAGIVPQENWVVTNSQDLYNAMCHLDLIEMQIQQRELWHADYKQGLKEQLLMAWEDHGKL